MEAYDLCVKTKEIEKTIEIAKKLGFKGLGLIIPYGRGFEKTKTKILKETKDTGMDIVIGVEIQGKTNEIKKIAKKIRKKHVLLVAKGGNIELNRAVVETKEIDILSSPLLENKKPGINHIIARLAAKNNVAIDFALAPVINSSKKSRSEIVSAMLEDARFVKKYKAPFVITSNALSAWDLRAPSELIAFGRFLGLPENKIKKTLSGEILKENRKRLSGKWIMPGVEVE